VRSDHLAAERQQPMAHFRVVLADAAGRDLPGREEQVLEMIHASLHLRVVEIDQHDDDAYGAAERRTGRRGPPHGAQWCTEREVRPGDDQSVVESWPLLRFHDQPAGDVDFWSAQRAQPFTNALPQRRAWRDETSAGVVSAAHR